MAARLSESDSGTVDGQLVRDLVQRSQEVAYVFAAQHAEHGAVAHHGQLFIPSG
jgi:hypothetical protein